MVFDKECLYRQEFEAYRILNRDTLELEERRSSFLITTALSRRSLVLLTPKLTQAPKSSLRCANLPGLIDWAQQEKERAVE